MSQNRPPDAEGIGGRFLLLFTALCAAGKM